MPSKTCIRCGKEKSYSEFSPDKRAADGLVGQCKSCRNSSLAAYRDRKRAEIREQGLRYAHSPLGQATRHQWYEENKQKVIASTKARRLADPSCRIPEYKKRKERYHLAEYGHLDYMSKNPKDRYAAARKLGFRSGLEVEIAKQLDAAGVPYEYEKYTIPFVQPAKERTYVPDYILPNGVIIETKGRFLTADRQKHLLIANQFPDLDIRFVFSNARAKISKRSKTSYGDWCRKNQFDFATKVVPSAWFQEELHPDTVKATMELLNWKPPKKTRRRKK